ncbi:MAG: hypothetical protein HDR23_07820 [Lachnospiraceae bacterium]|nr:hypothetical protein [Lachnospiraceae bacterium]MBD5456366.1 hypothetical protein [Lachnospiraceae bacterium]
MTFYELTFWLEDDQQERLSELAERYKKINDWDEKSLLQFALTALTNNANSVEMMLEFLEIKAEQLEKEDTK